MKKIIPGMKFGILTTIEVSGKYKDINLWLCECECGNRTNVRSSYLNFGKTKSCGCQKGNLGREDLSNKTFGILTVLQYDHTDKWKSSIWKCVCECGNETLASRPSLLNGNKISCGCKFKEWQNNKPKGKDSPHYDHSIIDRSDRRYDSYAVQWSKQIKKRDNFTCQICYSSPSNKLISHHLNSYKSFLDLRYDLNNGITLCRSCHIKFHKQYGIKNNTKEQFEEWKQCLITL